MKNRIETGIAPPGSPPPARGWPADAPGLDAAERALVAALDGAAPPIPAIGEVAARVARELSEIECRALRATLLEVDALPVRRAAAMRVRVGAAIAMAPPAGSSADADAIAALLSEIDDLLSDVNAIARSASPELAVALGACRGALVKEAIDFSEVAQRHAVTDARDVELPERWGASASSVSGVYRPMPYAAVPPRRRRRGLLLGMAVVVAVAVAWVGCHFIS